MLEILGKTGFDWQVALANLVNFVVIFLVLRKFAFKPLFKVVEERQNKIDQGLKDAEQAEQDLLAAEEIKKQKIQESRVSANEIVAEAQQKGNKIINTSQKEAEKEKKFILKSGQKELEDQKNKMEKVLEKQLSEMVLLGVEKVMKENLSAGDKQKMIEKSLTSFEFKS